MTISQDVLSQLTEFNYIPVIDGSGSNTKSDTKNGQSRWDYMKENLGAFCRGMDKIDSDGLDFVVMNKGIVKTYPGITGQSVDGIFEGIEPSGGTPLHEAIQAGIVLARSSNKKALLTVFTDGEPDYEDKVFDVIRDAANSAKTDDELNILFIQVGKDAQATKFLRKLDDNIPGATRDIVKSLTIEEAEQFDSVADMIVSALKH